MENLEPRLRAFLCCVFESWETFMYSGRTKPRAAKEEVRTLRARRKDKHFFEIFKNCVIQCVSPAFTR